MYCILITGIPASGKTTLAKALSRQMGIPWFSKDGIKEQLFDTVGFQSREEKVRLGIASQELLYYAAEQLMQCGLPFILENNFEDSSREGLARLLEAYSYQAVTILLTGDYRQIYQRFLAREQSPQRHRGHVVNDCYPGSKSQPQAISYEDFVRGVQARGMDRFTVGGSRIVLDATHPEQVDYPSLLRQIADCREEMSDD